MDRLQTLLKLAQDMQTEINEILQNQSQPDPKNSYILTADGVIHAPPCYIQNFNLQVKMGNVFPDYPTAEKASDAYRKFHRLWQLAEHYNNPDVPPTWIITKNNNYYEPWNSGINTLGAVVFTYDACETICKMLNSGGLEL